MGKQSEEHLMSAPQPVTPSPTGGGNDFARVPLRKPNWKVTALVLVICCGVYLPVMGSYGMFDPWETIYTEVGRQFMERDNWLSPYWHNGVGPEGWAETNFWSKPVGSFWLSGLSLKVFGLEDDITLRGTGRSLVSATRSQSALSPPRAGPDPGEVLATKPIEWAVRLPFFLCGLFGIFCIYLMSSRLFGRRTGVLAALILATAPMYFFITRQAMTDMPYVGLMSGGLALFMLAIFGEEEPLPRSRRALYLFLGGFVLLMGLIGAAIIPPLLHVALPVKVGGQPVSAAIWMAIYAVLALLFIWSARQTRTKNELYLYGFYAATAFAGLSKGLVGALQPGFVIVVYLLASWEWRLLSQVALGRGLMLAAAIFAPWWHAMVLAHGPRFWNELMGREQLHRLTLGEQAQAKGTWEYYLRQLAYGLFPWVAFLPAALARAFDIRRKRTARDRARLFVYLWFASTVVLFTLSVTKYNHYILPALPPTAVIIAIYLDDLIARRVRGAWIGWFTAIGVLAIVTVDLVTQPARWVWMFTYLYTPNWARGAPDSTLILVYALVFAALLLPLLWPRARAVLVWSLVAVAIGLGGYVLNWYQLSCSHHWGQKYVLQSYYRLREGPHEQLVAWQFNWRGETWYTAAQVVVAKSLENKAIKEWLNKRTGRRFFFVTERGRYPSLRTMLPTENARKTLRIVDDSNVHFVLAEAHL